VQTVLVSSSKLNAIPVFSMPSFHHAQLKARVRVTVWFQVITESQINMAKVYSHGEMMMLS